MELITDLLNKSAEQQLMQDLTFKPVSVDSVAEIRAVLQRAQSRSCDYTVGGLFLWIGWFNYEYCIVDNTLFIKGLSESDANVTAFSMPIGDMNLDSAMHLLRNYCARHNMKFVLSAIPDDCIDKFARYGGTIEPLEAWSDYVYDAERLATLAGKKLQKKRNHVNRFIAENPHYRFEDITSENIQEVATFFKELTATEADDESLMAVYEANMVSRVLAAGNELGFDGALLRGESGDIVAFTFGEVIGDTLHVHIEKMRHDVPGAGVSITKMFAESMLQRHKQVRYVNRQDDAGDEGLRRAKQSYYPEFILKKYNITF
jgi:hypothetical protein